MELSRAGSVADRTAAVRGADTACRIRPTAPAIDRRSFVFLPYQRRSLSRCPLRNTHFPSTHSRRVAADPLVDIEATEVFRRKLQRQQLDWPGHSDQAPLPRSFEQPSSSQAATGTEHSAASLTNGHEAAPSCSSSIDGFSHEQTLQNRFTLPPQPLPEGLHSRTGHDTLNSHLLPAKNALESEYASLRPISSPTEAPTAATSATSANVVSHTPQSQQTAAAFAVVAASDLSQELPSTSEAPLQNGAATDSTLNALQQQLQHIPQPILILSCVSMGLTMASCIFNSLMPVYMVTELKMSMRSMGMLEGILEAFSYLVRMCSGILSDMLANRKLTITAGFAMGAMAKFGLSFAGTVPQVFIGKAVDKLGNGVQAAPRDAMIGDLAPAEHRSSCFGFAQSLRKWGSTLGALSAYLLMRASDNNYQAIFLGAACLSAASTVAFALLVPADRPQPPKPEQQQQQQQPEQPQAAAGAAAPAVPQQQQRSARQHWQVLAANAKALGPKFFQFLLVVGLYGCGHIGEALLEARAVEVGFGKAEATLVVALLCFVVFLSAYPLGRLADKHGQRFTFTLGMAALIAGDLVLLTSGTFPMAVFVACIFWGMHWAVVQGPLLSIVVQLSPPHLRGTAFGIFYTVMAATAVAANSFYGYVWHTYSAAVAFGASAVLVAFTLAALPWLLPSEEEEHREQQEEQQSMKLKMA